ncbi:sulfotransferase domain-containing protein [Persicimonas caeni]|uniref:Sulfotransferase domain-containing protein n=1 Tax=Persicimonas caeni TaxID=2292766 RepID=A0A4Y6PX77_PERCE|nr:sulfotransferase domain-containing protein [Persicimonas caeni]QDG52863.1 sulfotransferase domain-containing protein [Persicimonas caeni]QED34085.1 sulfotransferase domain-containing protein [Persicimonas caeni]
MKILQIGAPKSGNFWTWNILQNTLDKAGLPNESLVRSHAIHEVAKSWDLSHDEQANIDMLDIATLGCSWRISSVFRMPVEDVGAYVAQNNHVWTHSRWCERTDEVLSHFDRAVYVVRDPRDRLLSAARFAFTPYMQKYWPHDEEDPRSFIENRFDEHLDEWRWHVYDYLRHADEHDIHFVFYERLLHDFDNEFGRLIDYLGVDLGERERKDIKRSVAFESMRGEHPGHVKKGKAGKWHAMFDSRQKGRAVVLCGGLLDLLDYPRYRPLTEDRLPSMPENLSSTTVERTARAG